MRAESRGERVVRTGGKEKNMEENGRKLNIQVRTERAVWNKWWKESTLGETQEGGRIWLK